MVVWSSGPSTAELIVRNILAVVALIIFIRDYMNPDNWTPQPTPKQPSPIELPYLYHEAELAQAAEPTH